MVARKMPSIKRWEVLTNLLKNRPHSFGIEVGVNIGNNITRLAPNLPNLKTVIGVDPYNEPPATKWGRIDNYLIFLNELQSTPQLKISYLKMPSEEASNLFQKEVFDFVFIDGDHLYESVKTDIKVWLPKVKPGGIMAGHDYRKGHYKTKQKWGVVEAVTESFKYTHKVHLEDDHVWWVKK